jgi:hypothetical protein
MRFLCAASRDRERGGGGENISKWILSLPRFCKFQNPRNYVGSTHRKLQMFNYTGQKLPGS